VPGSDALMGLMLHLISRKKRRITSIRTSIWHLAASFSWKPRCAYLLSDMATLVAAGLVRVDGHIGAANADRAGGLVVPPARVGSGMPVDRSEQG
jgi:hypothetical protein